MSWMGRTMQPRYTIAVTFAVLLAASIVTGFALGDWFGNSRVEWARVATVQARDYIAVINDEQQRSVVAAQEPAPVITDDPATWPDRWDHADEKTKSCSSKGRDGGKTAHGKGGTEANPTNCVCTNMCIKDGFVPGTPQFSANHGDPRCLVTCRLDTCRCRPRCFKLS